MLRYLLIPCVLAISGCGDSKETILARCEVEKARIFGRSDPEDKVQKPETDFIRSCMRADGYVLDLSGRGGLCEWFSQQRSDAACYKSNSFATQVISYFDKGS